ncbi:MAG: hypothetical protein ACR2PX_08845 [Endozoicomonas sp.]|uniref:hypothetical protein n=1 Tax=Endozoicomonas sp. TaxID=1892382 RepID=UPI003D9AF805
MPEEDLMVVSATFLALNVETKTDLYCTYIGKPYTDGFCDLEQLSADFYLHVLPYRSGSESLAKLQTELTTRLSGQSPKAKTYEDFCNNSRWMGRPCAVFWSPWSNYKYSEALNGEDRLYFTVLKMAAEIKAAMVLRYDFFLLANSPRLVSAQTSSFEKADIEEKVGKNAVSVLKKTVKPSNKTKAGPLTVKELSQLPVVYTRDRDFGERSRWTHAFNHFEKAELSLLDVHDEESYLCANQVPLYRIPANTQTLSIPLQERQLYRGASPLYGYEPCGSAGNLIEFVSYEEGAFRVEMHLNLNL